MNNNIINTTNPHNYVDAIINHYNGINNNNEENIVNLITSDNDYTSVSYDIAYRLVIPRTLCGNSDSVGEWVYVIFWEIGILGDTRCSGIGGGDTISMISATPHDFPRFPGPGETWE